MNKRKIVIDILVIMIAFILFVTWYGGKYNDIVTTSTIPISKSKVYLITMDKTDQFWYILNHGASDMADLLGITYIWDAPQERIVDEQIEIINNAVSDGADALLVAASDPVKVSGAIEDAKAKGVKIIYVDAPANEEGIITLATDNYSAGSTAGEIMLMELASEGIRNGSIGIVGVTPENITTLDREKGFRDVITDDGRFKLLITKYTAGNEAASQAASEELIAENSDLAGLLGTNESTTIGVGNTIKARKKEIVGVGFDITDTIQEMIREGTLKAVMVQNPYTMGYLGMAEAEAALRGYDTGPSFINTGVSVKTKYTY